MKLSLNNIHDYFDADNYSYGSLPIGITMSMTVTVSEPSPSYHRRLPTFFVYYGVEGRLTVIVVRVTSVSGRHICELVV
jgi:hypothetical protein